MTFLLHFIFITAFLLIYVITIIILKPFRIHRKRAISTCSLKLSYLLYLACFLMLAYLVLFFSAQTVEAADLPEEERIFDALTVFSIFAFFIPNIGIMIRRRITGWRETYNYVASVLNIFFASGIIWFMLDIPWEFS